MLQELSHMDRITQLQDEIQQLLQIMASSISYLTKRANFQQISPNMPVTNKRTEGTWDPPDVMAANRRELVSDLMLKAKQIEYLINSMPPPEKDADQDVRLKALADEMMVANAEYVQALDRAKNLHAHITETLETLLADPS